MLKKLEKLKTKTIKDNKKEIKNHSSTIENNLAIEDLANIIFSIINDGNLEVQSQKNSYSLLLHKAGINKIARKIGEEANEVIIAGFDNHYKNSEINKIEVVKESCDLIYHLLVLLASQKIDFKLITQELARRNTKK